MIHVFIVNPYAYRASRTEELREHLAKMTNFEYYVFSTSNKGDEANLVRRIRKIFIGEHIRFYCCGGSGTLRNMMMGIQDFSDVELAFYPCGLTNDMLKVFGDKKNRFEHIDNLIYGDVYDVDYIKTNKGLAFNTLSVGMDSIVVKKIEDFRILATFGSQLPYYFAVLYALFFCKNEEYIIEAGDEEYNMVCSHFFFGNGRVLGGSLHFVEGNVNITDGVGHFRIIPKKNLFRRLAATSKLRKNKADSISGVIHGEVTNIKIRRKDGKPLDMNYDGELVTADTIEATMVHKGMRFVLPRGMRFEE